MLSLLCFMDQIVLISLAYPRGKLQAFPLLMRPWGLSLMARFQYLPGAYIYCTYIVNTIICWTIIWRQNNSVPDWGTFIYSGFCVYLCNYLVHPSMEISLQTPATYVRHVGRRNNTIYLLSGKWNPLQCKKYFIVLSSNMALLYVAGIYTLSLTRNPRFSFPVPDWNAES